MDDIISEIKENLSIMDGAGDEIAFSDPRYRSIPLSPRNFKEIGNVRSLKSVCFVDGGNMEILKTPNLSVHLVRAAFVIFQNGRKIAQNRVESFSIAKYRGDRDAYSLKIPALFPDEIFFSSSDETIREGNHRASISKMGEVARRFLEIELAKDALKFLSAGDILVRDGTLQTSVTGEGRFLIELYDLASAKRVTVSSLAKTTALLTKKGNNAVSALASIAPAGRWLYYPSVEINHPDHLAEMYFARLHAASKHIFRIEFYKKSRYDAPEMMSLLSENSTDGQFPGYPYGLMLADRLAKVQVREQEVYCMKILAKLGRELESGISALDAHERF